MKVTLYEHLYNVEIEPEERVAITHAVSTMTDLDAAYSNVNCGHYYLEITGDVGDYILTWAFSDDA